MASVSLDNPVRLALKDGLAISISGLYLRFGKIHALRGLYMSVPRGSITGFIGNNGAGKTTTIHTLLGFLPPHAGSVRVLDLNPQKDAVEIRRRVGFFPERDQPYDWMKLRTLFDIGAAAYADWDKSYCSRLCAQFELNVHRKIKELSKGMVAKAKLIFALSHHPQCLVLDEPTGGLDPTARHELLHMIRQLATEQTVTALFSSHNLDDVTDIASDLVMIHEGKVLFSDRMDTIKNDLALIEAKGWSAGPPDPLRQLLIKAVHQDGASFWLVRDRHGDIVNEFSQRQSDRFLIHQPSLAVVFLLLTRDWIELGSLRGNSL